MHGEGGREGYRERVREREGNRERDWEWEKKREIHTIWEGSINGPSFRGRVGLDELLWHSMTFEVILL